MIQCLGVSKRRAAPKVGAAKHNNIWSKFMRCFLLHVAFNHDMNHDKIDF